MDYKKGFLKRNISSKLIYYKQEIIRSPNNIKIM